LRFRRQRVVVVDLSWGRGDRLDSRED